MEFSTIQLGVDVATSLAILASAVTFMVNQRLKARETKRRQLDESVRAVTVDEFQSALGELSGIYVKEIVERAAPLQNSVGAGLERLEKSLRINPERSAELLESMSSTKKAMGGGASIPSVPTTTRSTPCSTASRAAVRRSPSFATA